MFSAVNDMIPLFRPRRRRDDRDEGEKKLHVGDEAGRPSNADRAQGRTQGAAAGTSCAGRRTVRIVSAAAPHPRKIKALKRVPRNGKIFAPCMM